MLVLLVIQVSLGAATVLSRRAVIPTTSHVAIGAALLATCVALALRAWHFERAPRAHGGGAARVTRFTPALRREARA